MSQSDWHAIEREFPLPQTKRAGKTARDAARLTQQLMLTPMVMAMRMPIMAAEAGLGGGAESAGAVNEKVKAMADGVAAAQMAFLKGTMLLPFAMMRPFSANGPFVDLANEIAVAAMTPAARQVSRNHKRLTQRK